MKSKQIVVFILVTLVSAITVFTLIAAYRCFPQDKVVFDDKQYLQIQDFEIWINGTEEVTYEELPLNLFLEYHDTVTMTTTLEGPYVAGAVLFFYTTDTSVTVSINGQEVYQYGMGSRTFGRAPFRVWHFVELPDDYVGKEVAITQQQLLHPSSIPKVLYPVGLSTKATALVDYFYPTYGLLLYLAVSMAVVSLGFLIFSLVLMRYDKNAVKILYFFLIFLHISVWGICNNSMTTLFFNNSYFVYCLHYLLHASLMIPIMLYFGESYQKRYRKIFHNIILFDLIKLLFLLISELLTIRTLTENLFVINAVLIVEIIIIIAVVIWELVHKTKENGLIIYGAVCLSLLGLFEIIRLYVFDKSTISNALYYGVASLLAAGAVETIYDYFKEADNLNLLKMQNQKVLQLLDIQQGYYQRISSQLHVAKQAAHDFNHYNTMIYGAIQSGNTEKLEKLLEKTSDIYKNMQMTLYTQCLEINSIINFTAETCTMQNIKFTPVIRELDCNINLYDLCIIIGNMLDNAVEGAATTVDKESFVTFFTNRNENKLYMGAENSYSGNLNIVAGKIRTSKQDKNNHGLGLSIIEEILKRYDGELWLDSNESIFKVLVMIPDNKS